MDHLERQGWIQLANALFQEVLEGFDVVIGFGFEQANARAGVDVNLPYILDVEGCARGTISRE